MKKDKQKSIKAAQKIIKKDLKRSLVAKLKEVINSLGHRSEKLEKEIEKVSDKLAKKLSKEIKTGLAERVEPAQEQTTIPKQVSDNTTGNTQASSDFVKNSALKSKSTSRATKMVKQEA